MARREIQLTMLLETRAELMCYSMKVMAVVVAAYVMAASSDSFVDIDYSTVEMVLLHVHLVMELLETVELTCHCEVFDLRNYVKLLSVSSVLPRKKEFD